MDDILSKIFSDDPFLGSNAMDLDDLSVPEFEIKKEKPENGVEINADDNESSSELDIKTEVSESGIDKVHETNGVLEVKKEVNQQEEVKEKKDELGESSSHEETDAEEVEEEAAAQMNFASVPLLDLLQLTKKEKFQPTIPDAVTEQLMHNAGCSTNDPKMVKLISLAAQKFMAEIANDALQHYKMRGAPQVSRFRSREDEKRNTLTMDDLVPSVAEHGIVAKKMPYFV